MGANRKGRERWRVVLGAVYYSRRDREDRAIPREGEESWVLSAFPEGQGRYFEGKSPIQGRERSPGAKQLFR